MRAKAWMLQQRHREALQLLENIEREQPMAWGLWTALAHTYMALREWNRRVLASERAWSVMTERVSAPCYLGFGLLGKGQPEAALGPFGRVISSRHDYAAPWLGRGRALAALGRRREAIQAFDHALGVNGRNPCAYEHADVVAAAMEARAHLMA